jgi:flagellin-like hook-associated protein FlgL
MADISLSKAVRSNLLSLKGTADMMASTQNRLATGNKVNSALDNPSSWFTAQGLTNRASDLGSLLDSMANGVKTLEAADNGLTAMTKTLESMQSTLRQARQDKSFQTHSMTLANIDPNSEDLGKLTLSGGSVGDPASIDLTKTGSGAKTATTAQYVAPEAAAPATISSSVDAAAAFDDTAAQAAIEFTIEFGGKEVDISIAADAGATRTVDDLNDLIQEQIDISELAGELEIAVSSGEFTITAQNNVDGSIAVSGTDAATLFGAEPADPDDIQDDEFTAVAGSDGQHSFTINGKEIVLDTTDGADLATAVASINEQLGDKAKFEAFEEVGGKIGLRATADDAGALKIGGDDAALFGSPTAGVVTVAATAADDLKFAMTVDELVSSINTNDDLEGKVRASNDNGKLRIENLSTEDLKIEGLSTTGALSGEEGAATVLGNSVRAGLADQFNELRDQLDKLADDASFNGINLLRGDKLSITFNETGTSSIDIQTKDGETVNSSNLGVATTLEAKDLDTDANIDAELGKLKSALNDVRAQASSFGSNLSIVENRQSFTNAMINTLEDGAGNLTLADMNTEAANLLALQTRQSLSQNSLSLASQADQSILQLIR